MNERATVVLHKAPVIWWNDEPGRGSPGDARQTRRGGVAAEASDPRAPYRDALNALHERTGETVHTAFLVGMRTHCVDGIAGRAGGVRFGLRLNVWLPAH